MGLKYKLSDEDIYEIAVNEIKYGEIFMSLPQLESSAILLNANAITFIGNCTVKITFQVEEVAKIKFNIICSALSRAF